MTRNSSPNDKKNVHGKFGAAFLPWKARNAKIRGWIAYDIVWDGDGSRVDLPTTVFITDENVGFDDVVDHLFKKFGRKVYSLGIRPLT
ncbi:MAG: hypothetical protein IJP92_16330 [Lachnospiraceae bacterium]|nr:hypothetical protein [Lachnospiraceae bacterium]